MRAPPDDRRPASTPVETDRAYVRPSREPTDAGRGMLSGSGPSPARRRGDSDISTPPPAGMVREGGRVRPLRPGMERGPTELVGLPRDVTRHTSSPTRYPGMYHHPMLGAYRPFPSEVPIPREADEAAAAVEEDEEEEGQQQQQQQQQQREEAPKRGRRVRAYWDSFRGLFVFAGGEQPKTKPALVISRPTDFRKTT